MKLKFIFCILLLNISAMAQGSSLAKVSDLLMKNQTQQALIELQKMVSAKAIHSDLAALTKGRIHFQRAELEKSIEEYKKIPKSSEYWFEAQEERGHALGRLGKYNESIAALESVLAEPFNRLTGPEPYFITALTYLKICSYTDVLKTTERYKKRFTERVSFLNELVKNKTNAQLEDIRLKLNKEPLSLNVTGKHLAHIPRYLHRDLLLIENPKLLDRRAIALAHTELKEIEKVTTKLQLIEAEVVQRIHLSERSGNREKQGSINAGSDYLTFPKDDDIWIDEIGNYQAEVEKCPGFKAQVSL